MKSATALPVPSKTLLRYLRAQCDNTYAHANVHARRSDPGATFAVRHSVTSKRNLSTTVRQRPTTQSHQRDGTFTKHHGPLKVLLPPRFTFQPSHLRYVSTRVQRTQPRATATIRWSSLWSRLRGKNGSVPRQDRTQTQSYDDTSAQLFNLSRALARSPAASDLKLRCTEFDTNGNVTLVSGEFKKSELIAKYGLQPRDLRKIDSSVLPHILVRPTAILINLLHLRVLIQCDRVLVFDAYGSTDSYTQSMFMYDLEGKLRQKPDPRSSSTHLPYEFRALEAVLISVTSGLEAEFALVRDPVTHILRELEEDIDRDKLRHLLIHSKKLGTFEQKARLVRDAINDLLEADDDLAAMYLTERKKSGKPRPEDDHQEVEMLLESYHKICDEIVEISGNLITSIRTTEEVVRAMLDSNRNQLMLLDLKFSIGTLGLAGGTLLAGLYGMNLENFIEETNWGFGSVTGVSFVFSGLICIYGMRKLRSVQKVKMFGEGLDGIAASRQFRERSTLLNEAMQMDQQARLQRIKMMQDRGLWQQQQHGGGHHGPVLWPGMDGLGMHKLNQNLAPAESCPLPGQHGDSTDQYGFRIHDDMANTEERMRKEIEAQKGVTPVSGGRKS